MMKIEVYYNEENDCVQLVKDGVLVNHDEGIYSTDFLCYFKEGIEDIHELIEVPSENILKGYEYLRADFDFHNGKKQ